MAYEVRDGYQKIQDKEPLILEPEDWSSNEWATICKLCGLPLGQTERIVLHADEMECFIDLSKKAMDGDRTYTVTEVCPNCESEIEMRWDTDTMGFKAFCPVCGNRLMLCDECRHAETPSICDYDRQSDSCRHNSSPAAEDGASKEAEKPMDIHELGQLMVEHRACLRAIPNKVRSVLEASHADEYPTGKIVFLPEFKREMLVVESVPDHAGQFLVKTGLGTMAMVDFNNLKFYETLEDAIKAMMKKEK